MKSKRQSKNSQQPNDPVYFLDRQLGAYKLPGILRAAGFIVVSHLERYGTQRDREPDPSIALECGRQKNVLITADPDFEHTYGKEVREARIAVFYLTNNHDGAEVWGARILTAHSEMRRELGRRRKPFVAHITTEGRINKIRLYYKRKIKTIKLGKKKKQSSR
ncbi:MAG: hypothetical protein DMG96_18565 [Acidobacteria bacterium]|nr:MAG: hypothetical protein DMG96_18565 [Acidobacteriota bacterium]